MAAEDNVYLKEEDLTLFRTVTAIYRENESIRDTAIRTELSRSKVRKILITMGVITSEITERAMPMLMAGMTMREVAAELGISTGTLSTYLPYDKRVQGREERSNEAIRSENYRARQARAAAGQVVERKDEKMADMIARKEQSKEETSALGTEVYRLHLELNLKNADTAVLKKWGKMNKSISRDLIVTPNMTLHALHYAIQKCFGWENSHLHHFEFVKNDFDALVKNSFVNYLRFCGLYFRFPYGDDDMALEDVYWDDDYEEGESFKSWLRKKYNPPFYYGGQSELFLVSRMNAKDFYNENRTLKIGPSFSEYLKGNKQSREVNIDDATYEDMFEYFECSLGELVEKAPIMSMLRPLNEHAVYGTLDVAESIEKAAEISAELDKSFKADMDEFVDLYRLRKKCSTAEKKGKREAEILKAEYCRRMDKLMRRTELILPPVCTGLLYKYDYGDGWEVSITMTDDYRAGLCAGEIACFYDKDGQMVDDELFLKLKKTATTFEPACVFADGLPVMDDVGGIYGYCDFLNGIHGIANNGPYEDAESSRKWAGSMGWTGRMSKAERIL